MKNSKFNGPFWFTNLKNTFLLRFCHEIIGKALHTLIYNVRKKAYGKGSDPISKKTLKNLLGFRVSPFTTVGHPPVWSALRILLFFLLTTACGNHASSKPTEGTDESEQTPPAKMRIETGADRTEAYLSLLENKRVGIVANPSSIIFRDEEKTEYVHLVDSLMKLDVNVQKVFAPEHGFRGTADAGEVVKDGKDPKTGLPVISLYGNNKKPKQEQLKDIDILIFDLQDVGVRFYTYISTLHYVMEACAETGKQVIVLDRPNPNGHFVDGPVLDPKYKSFVGMHPIPIAHGMTIGEYALMINGEKWLANGIQCPVQVISCANYTKDMSYELPVKPSPNLPNVQAINLYPSTCLFEGTNISEGRGTDKQFQVYGSPYLSQKDYPFSFTPKPNSGSKSPKYNGKMCYGEDLSKSKRLDRIELQWLIRAYNHTENKGEFFTDFFSKLAGSQVLQQQIETGITEDEIRRSWKKDLLTFRKVREKYLIYKDI
ncbi:exo-beta-N-acetylmuramidase NamZ family protein [Sinomicrobium sp. M5D2P17]